MMHADMAHIVLVKVIENLSGHLIDLYKIHGNKWVLLVKNDDQMPQMGVWFKFNPSLPLLGLPAASNFLFQLPGGPCTEASGHFVDDVLQKAMGCRLLYLSVVTVETVQR